MQPLGARRVRADMPPRSISQNSHRATSTRPPLTRAPRSRMTTTHTSLSSSRAASEVPSPTPSSAAAARLRSPGTAMAGIKRKDRDFDADAMGGEETNINVVVRCRGRNDREVRENSGVVVAASDGVRGKNVELSMGPNALSNKTYNFDKVFSPAADQAMIYEDVVAPILDEMLAGFNCTIFAYGQTGTGKTYTMSGDMTNTLGLLSDAAGIIPRVLHALFRKLEADETECSIKCSFIELYNEELRDLLAADENTRLKIFDDAAKKGHGGTVVQGMEESHIKTANEGVQLLQHGSQRRQVAATKCNDLSSRSHTVFSITVYTKRPSDVGEELVSAGKLNLVDLAGSENIQRSGAENKRAAEAGLINKSLLTLGRVINALVDKSSHIPYRESKLTRLLQDSLGGRTKTCIIATLSPAKSNLEETISTLDYAFRAKNIRNKPQMNMMISKKTLLRDYTTEIEKLKSELIATRQRNGVYLSNQAYEDMTTESESRRILSEEQKAKLETMENNLRHKVQDLYNLTNDLALLKKDHEITRLALDDRAEVLSRTETILAMTKQHLADETRVREAYAANEVQLGQTSDELLATVQRSVMDIDGLHLKLRRRSDLDASHRSQWQDSQQQIAQASELVQSHVIAFNDQQQDATRELASRIDGFVRQQLKAITDEQHRMEEDGGRYFTEEKTLRQHIEASNAEAEQTLEEIADLRADLRAKVTEGLRGLEAAAGSISAGIINELDSFHTQLHQSYSTLGKDLKSTFETLTDHLQTHSSAVHDSYQTLAEATRTAVEEQEAIRMQLDQVRQEEREQAASDRRNLLSQITSLIESNGQAQDHRWERRMGSFQGALVASRTSLDGIEQACSERMQKAVRAEGQLREEVTANRDALKSRLQHDWTTVDGQHARIASTTKAVHAETMRLVDEQLTTLASQMEALDECVTQARSRRKDQETVQRTTLDALAEVISSAQAGSLAHLDKTRDHTSTMQGEALAQTAAMAASWPQLAESLTKPLTDLRKETQATSLLEYQITGTTPPKTQYRYPRKIPRTAARKDILGQSDEKSSPRVAPSTSPTAELRPVEDTLGPSSTVLTMSSSPTPGNADKAVVYTDADAHDDRSSSQSPDDATTISRPPTVEGTGLREVSVNVSAGMAAAMASARSSSDEMLLHGKATEAVSLSRSLMGPPTAPSVTTVAASGARMRKRPHSTVGVEGKVTRSRRGSLGANANGGSTASKLSSAVMRADGRENVQLAKSASATTLATSVLSTGPASMALPTLPGQPRRLRSSLVRE